MKIRIAVAVDSENHANFVAYATSALTVNECREYVCRCLGADWPITQVVEAGVPLPTSVTVQDDQ